MQRIEKSPISQCGADDTHTNPCFIHHLKHGCQPLTFFSYQPADCPPVIAKTKGGSGRATLSHFVQHTGKVHIIALRQLAFIVGKPFGRKEE
ncbi:hypothetical protein D3C72_2047140 [compost metagenome]